MVTGYDLGMNTWGGFSQYIRVPANWVVKKPIGLTFEEAMTFGTAGFTAAQCVEHFSDNGLSPSSGPILVTGATGGVGSVAVCLLSHLGYEVVAATRNLEKLSALCDLHSFQDIPQMVAEMKAGQTRGRVVFTIS